MLHCSCSSYPVDSSVSHSSSRHTHRLVLTQCTAAAAGKLAALRVTCRDMLCAVCCAVLPMSILPPRRQGSGVADTIRSGITNLEYFVDRPDILAYGE